MSKGKLCEARELCARLQSVLLDLAVDYTVEVKKPSHNKRVTVRKASPKSRKTATS